MKGLLLALALAVSSYGQAITQFKATTGDVALTAASTQATLQAVAFTPNVNTPPVSTGEQIVVQTVTVYCSVACAISEVQNCTTAASSTAGTIQGTLPTPTTAFTTTFWTASNASGCTTIDIVHLAAAGSITFPTTIQLGRGGNTQNYGISIGSITGTANITFQGYRIS